MLLINRFITWASFHVPQSGPIRNLGKAVLKFFYPRYYFKPVLEGRELSEIFTEHYESNYWGSKESVSGYGSTLKFTANLRRELPGVFEKCSVQTILDAPCGDYNWFRHVGRDGDMQYIGADIVSELIESNQEKYGNSNTRFIRLDITKDPLPKADLWMCRDALFHLSHEDIALAFENLMKSKVKYVLFTSHHECTENKDILSGDFRPLNLELAPFDLPKPILAIDDWIKGFEPRRMCLWETKSLSKIIPAISDRVLNAKAKEHKLA